MIPWYSGPGCDLRLYIAKGVVTLSVTISYNGKDKTAGGGWSTATEAQKRKYRMIWWATCKDADLVYKWMCTLFKIHKRRIACEAYPPPIITALPFSDKWKQICWALTIWTRCMDLPDAVLDWVLYGCQTMFVLSHKACCKIVQIKIFKITLICPRKSLYICT